MGVLEMYPEIYQEGRGVKFVAMPRFADGQPYTTKYGSLFITLNQSKHKEEAWLFQDAILDYAGDFLATGLFIPVKGYAQSEGAKKMPGFETFREILSWPGSEQIRTNEAGAIFSEALTRVLFQQADIRSSLEAADKQMIEYLSTKPF
jgi:ABC-type glycerol-3-phosphate transport system substrate-binding protein